LDDYRKDTDLMDTNPVTRLEERFPWHAPRLQSLAVVIDTAIATGSGPDFEAHEFGVIE
jgi:hypothetical protein